VFVSIKHIEKEKNYLLTLGIEPTWFVSEEYCRLVNAVGCLRVQQTTTLSQHPSMEAELASQTPWKINEF
jgi:hypothetical protein